LSCLGILTAVITMNLKIKCLILCMVFFIFLGMGCGGGKKSSQKPETQKKPPEAFVDIEKGALNIMQQADLVPIIEKNMKEEQKEAEAGANQQESKEKTRISDLTYEDTLLGELLKTEGLEMENKEIPQETAVIWDNIASTITNLHTKWNELQPQVIKESVPQEKIDDFERQLDILTVFSNEQNYFNTMVAANMLTGNLAELVSPFVDQKVLPVYEFGYHLRNTVLYAAADDYKKAEESLDYITRRAPVLEQSLSKEKFQALEFSLEDLQRALQKQNLELTILNAAVVMENVGGAKKD
jgi:hypothetical protein